MLLFPLAFLFLGGAVIAIVHPRSQLGPQRSTTPSMADQPDEHLDVHNSDGREPSTAGVATIPIAGLIMFIASIVLTIKGFQQVSE